MMMMIAAGSTSRFLRIAAAVPSALVASRELPAFPIKGGLGVLECPEAIRTHHQQEVLKRKESRNIFVYSCSITFDVIWVHEGKATIILCVYQVLEADFAC